MGLNSYEPRDRLAAYLRARFSGEHQTKRLASAISCTPKTAENILNGHWPNSRHWAAIARSFGRDVIEAVFSPEIDETVARLEQEVRALEEQLEKKREAARQISGRRSVASRPVAPVLDRSALERVGLRANEPQSFKSE